MSHLSFANFQYSNIFFQDAAKPVEELPFPSVTICSPGLNMGAVEEALLEDFNQWLSENGKTDEGSLEYHLDEFMEAKYATTAENIFETIKGMNSPPPSSEEESNSGASAVLQNLIACEARDDQDDKSSRKKRSSEGEGFCSWNFSCIFVCLFYFLLSHIAINRRGLFGSLCGNNLLLGIDQPG